MDQEDCMSYLEEQFRRYESICKRCGACCGADDGDPCINLIRNEDGTYFCKVYENRLGEQKTVSGKIFHCIQIKDVIMNSGARPDCAYRRYV